MLQCNVYQARRQVFLPGGGGGWCEPLGESGGMFPREILKIRLSENALRAF